MLRCDSFGDLYTFPSITSSTTPVASLATITILWHHRLGHPAPAAIDTLRSTSSITCNKVASSLCHACQLGKHIRLPFTRSQSRSTAPFELVHCDVWTSPVASISGFQYYLVLLDDYSHFAGLFPLVANLKSHLTSLISLHMFKPSSAPPSKPSRLTMELSSSTAPSLPFSPHMAPSYGCLAHTHPHRMVRTSASFALLTSVKPSSSMPTCHTCHNLLNRRPCSSTNNAVPYTLLHSTSPDYPMPTMPSPRVFGWLCYPNLSATTPRKLAPRSTACVFLGYPSSHQGVSLPRPLDSASYHLSPCCVRRDNVPLLCHSPPGL